MKTRHIQHIRHKNSSKTKQRTKHKIGTPDNQYYWECGSRRRGSAGAVISAAWDDMLAEYAGSDTTIAMTDSGYTDEFQSTFFQNFDTYVNGVFLRSGSMGAYKYLKGARPDITDYYL